MPDSMSELKPIVSEIVEEYKAWREPFERDMLPEKRAIVGIDDPAARARYLTFVVSINYQRDAENLWQKTRALWDDEPWIFDPKTLVEERSLPELTELFRERSMRFGKGDAEIWYTNAKTFYEEYGGTPMKLFGRNRFDALSVLESVRTHDGFTYLGGDKIGPLWMRLIHEDVHALTGISDVMIPVDTHIRKVTSQLRGREAPDADIRQFWTSFCRTHGFDPVKVDQPLWLIGTHWHDWGQSYLEAKLDGRGLAPERSHSMVPSRSEYASDGEWVAETASETGIEPAVVWAIYDELSGAPDDDADPDAGCRGA